MGAALLLVPLVPLLLLAALAHRGWRARAAALAWVAPLPGLACAVLAPGARLVFDERLGLTLALDAPGALLLGGAALLWCGASIFARAYLDAASLPRFAAWWLPTMAGSLGIFLAGDLLSFYMLFALASLPAWGLVVHDRTARAWDAGATYILLTVVGEAALLAAFVLMAAAAPGDSLALAEVVPALRDAALRDVTVALLLIGFGLKAGLVPLHVWLPIAHPAAPMPASAVLSGAIVKAGIIGLVRFLPFDGTFAAWGNMLFVVGFGTAFWGVGCGILQRNPKTVLAYSTVSQMGVTIAALGAGIAAGLGTTPAAATFYGLVHMLAKGALFLAVGVAAASGGRARWLVLVPALVLALGFGGLPFTGGWLAKEAVKMELGGGVAGMLSALSAAGSTMLMLHFVGRLAAGRAENASERPARGILLPWLGLAAASLLVPVLCVVAVGGSFGASLRWAALAKALWPVLAGALLFGALLRWGGRLPGIPEGDVILPARRVLRLAAPIGPVLTRAEAALRAWPAAGIALLAVALALGALMLSSGRTG
jgi:formate hydrogenlyase subunit 3/multisubunit Na+/H+ antiporter MnhD subunit